MIEIKPYGFEENGKKYYAECFPYIDNIPIPAIAHCQHCTHYNTDENELCFGWKDNPQDAPLYCGPVCPKFELVSSTRRVLERKLDRCRSAGHGIESVSHPEMRPQM
jgi:hypothetical protein